MPKKQKIEVSENIEESLIPIPQGDFNKRFEFCDWILSCHYEIEHKEKPTRKGLKWT